MCTGRVDLAFINRAFAGGADGVLIGGCWPGECHYVTEGNYDALANVYLYRKLMRRIGVRPERLRIEWLAASQGTRYAEVMDEFVGELKGLGPLGVGEGVGPLVLRAKLAAIDRLVPYLKLVERERLRAPVRSEAAYEEFYRSAETERLFNELVADRLATGEIVALLRERPLSTAEIAAALGLSPSEVSRLMNTSSRQGLVRYDVEQQRYALG